MIKENLEEVRNNIRTAAGRAGRDVSDVTLIAVSKTKPVELIKEAYDLGERDFGENRVQEITEKYPVLPKDIRWHLIGHLQTNKVKYIISSVSMIQSVDSIRLAQEIDRLAVKNGLVMDVLCEVNIGGEESKSGIAPAELEGLLKEVSSLEGLRLRGLMTIPPPSDSDVFLGRMQELYNRFAPEYSFDTLSMGMTHDYAQAVKYGSTLVRIGTGLFGARNYNK